VKGNSGAHQMNQSGRTRTILTKKKPPKGLSGWKKEIQISMSFGVE
jgi:hypothetical protein